MMTSLDTSADDKQLIAKALSVTIHVGLVLLILFWCFKISQPFIEVIAWGIIIAVAIHPADERLNRMMGGRPRLSVSSDPALPPHQGVEHPFQAGCSPA